MKQGWGLVIVFNATFSFSFDNINSYIKEVSFIGKKKTLSIPRKHLLQVSHWWTLSQCCIKYTSPWARFELTTLVFLVVVKGTDCICSCKSNYHTIMTTAAPSNETVKKGELSSDQIIIKIYSSTEVTSNSDGTISIFKGLVVSKQVKFIRLKDLFKKIQRHVQKSWFENNQQKNMAKGPFS